MHTLALDHSLTLTHSQEIDILIMHAHNYSHIITIKMLLPMHRSGAFSPILLLLSHVNSLPRPHLAFVFVSFSVCMKKINASS